MNKVIALVALMLTSFNVFAAGSIEGRVGDKGENVFLQGAIVTVVELNRQTSTSSNGAYRFGSIPAGSYTVRVDYLGAETTEMKVNVRDDQIALQDFRLSVRGDLVEEVIVYGQAAGTASALNQQRSADYVTTIVSADDIGQFPDQNVAEALQRLPGIFVERDQGEGRFIGIRGISPNLNNTKINGLNVPAPESDRRSVALDVIPSELLEGLEVAKTFTPDMDGDGIGGHIDIKSLSAFDRDGAFLNIGAETSYTDLDEEHSPKVNIAAGNVFSIGDDTDNLGVAATISRPTFGQVSPGGEIELEEDDGEFELGAEIGNPNLEAIEADNFDFSIEYYPGGIGVLSAAVFHKSLENPIIVIDNADNIDLTEFAGNIPLDDAEVIQPINGDDADLTGVELAWTWTAEEGPAAGLILGLNATFTDGEASLPERDIDLPGLSDTVWNASIGYENQRLSLRLAATYKSENLLEVLDTEDPLFDRYQDDHLQVDFTARYRFTDAFQVYFNAINMTDEPFYAYFDRTAYNSQYDDFGRTYILGVRYNMQ